MTGRQLKLDNLHAFYGKSHVLHGVSLAVNPGEIVSLLGRNGAGRSTMVKAIMGQVDAKGSVMFGDTELVGRKAYEIAHLGLGYVPENRDIFPKLSVFENLRCGVLWSLGYRYTFLKFLANLEDANDRAEALMEMIRLDRKRDILAMNLTYAEQRALEIGITIAGGAGVILLDEPTAGMSKSETTRFIHLIREVTEGKTLLTVEHDMGVVFGLADKIAVLVYGEVIAFDTPDAVRANARVQEAYLGSVLAEVQP